RALLDDRAFVDSAVAADHYFVFDDHRHGAHRFDDATDLRARRDVTIFPDLRAAADQGVRVHHRVFVYVRTAIDEHSRHADHAARDKAGVADARAAGPQLHTFVPMNGFDGIGGLVKEGLCSWIRPHLHDGAHPEAEENTLLNPGIDAPARSGTHIGLGCAHFAAVQSVLELLKESTVLVRVLCRRTIE